jgi:hypothetical protein
MIFIPRGTQHTFADCDARKGLDLLIIFAPNFSGGMPVIGATGL